MLLRPIGFSIPSTTELKITFSEEVSSSISISNFEVESLNGAVSDLEVRGVTVDGKVVTVKTAPQVERNYYLLKLLDSTEQRFISEKEKLLIDPILRFYSTNGFRPWLIKNEFIQDKSSGNIRIICYINLEQDEDIRLS